MRAVGQSPRWSSLRGPSSRLSDGRHRAHCAECIDTEDGQEAVKAAECIDTEDGQEAVKAAKSHLPGPSPVQLSLADSIGNGYRQMLGCAGVGHGWV